jgi:hypothetical protein
MPGVSKIKAPLERLLQFVKISEIGVSDSSYRFCARQLLDKMCPAKAAHIELCEANA